MKRVMIVGGPGSGKSTLARQLGASTGLPVYHMDRIHWQPGWQERDRESKLAMAHEIECKDTWIFEGGLSATYDHRLARADTLIWLDLPVGLRLWRVTKRMLRYWGRSRPDLPEGCPEGLHAETVPFYIWIWQTRHTGRERLAELAEAAAPTAVYHLRRPSEVRAFLRGL